jgi:hypothetical protein
MTEVSRVAAQTSEMYRQLDIKKLDKRHEELRIEEQRVRLNLRATEQAQLDMNRRTNRPGQNVDKIA